MIKKTKLVLWIMTMPVLTGVLIGTDVIARDSYDGPFENELISPKVTIPKKDLDHAIKLISSKDNIKRVEVTYGGSFYPVDQDPVEFFARMKREADKKDPNLVVVSNSDVVCLAKDLDINAGDKIAKSEYEKAAELLKAAILIIEDSGRNATDLEKYESEYCDLIRKMDKDKDRLPSEVMELMKPPPPPEQYLPAQPVPPNWRPPVDYPDLFDTPRQ